MSVRWTNLCGEASRAGALLGHGESRRKGGAL